MHLCLDRKRIRDLAHLRSKYLSPAGSDTYSKLVELVEACFIGDSANSRGMSIRRREVV